MLGTWTGKLGAGGHRWRPPTTSPSMGIRETRGPYRGGKRGCGSLSEWFGSAETQAEWVDSSTPSPATAPRGRDYDELCHLHAKNFALRPSKAL
jgi:hypothetical protein